MSKLWSDDARFALWLEIETIVLEALVAEGLAPERALKSVREKGAFDAARIDEIEATVKHDVIAFLTNVAEHVGEDARFLHLGMTSSDLLDTAFSIQLCRASDSLLASLDRLMAAVKVQAEKHKRTPCVGRSHGIHAEPTTFGLKVATWYAELSRQKKRLVAARAEIAVGAFSGPVGTFAYLDPKVEAFVCKRLGLEPDPVSTQIISRDRHAELFHTYALLGATLERIVLEIRHLQRTEVREAEESFGGGQKGSSSMPHKRNPVLSENVTGLARLLRAWAGSSYENVALWHERDISHSSVERVIAPDMTITLDFMLHRVTSIVEKLVVYPENMQRNLDLTDGLVFSGALLVELAKKGISREDAYRIVQKHALAAWDRVGQEHPTGPTFRARVDTDEEIRALLSPAEIADVFSLERHFAHVDTVFSRVFRTEGA